MFERTGDEMKKVKMIKNISILLLGSLLILIAIVPNGTFSFFSSIKPTYSTLAVGTCNQEVTSDVNYQLNDLYPGQETQKMNINIKNDGTLVLDELELTADLEVKDENGEILTGAAVEKDFFSQFTVNIVSSNVSIESVTFSELKQGIELTKIEQLNIVEGLHVGEELNLEIQIIFNEETETQAQYEGWSLSTEFFIEGMC